MRNNVRVADKGTVVLLSTITAGNNYLTFSHQLDANPLYEHLLPQLFVHAATCACVLPLPPPSGASRPDFFTLLELFQGFRVGFSLFLLTFPFTQLSTKRAAVCALSRLFYFSTARVCCGAMGCFPSGRDARAICSPCHFHYLRSQGSLFFARLCAINKFCPGVKNVLTCSFFIVTC